MILFRMTRRNGCISLALLEGILKDIRNKMNVEIVKFTGTNSKSHSSLGDLIFVD